MKARKLLAIAVGLGVALLPSVASAGTGWVIQPTINPSGSSNGGSNNLKAVSCTSPASCTAVGYYVVSGTTTVVTLAEYWDGTSWAFQLTPNPTSNNELNSVSCTSAANCIAVGDTSGSSGQVPLAERWNGSSWKIQSVPRPAGGTSSELDGVSCTSMTACTAVGKFLSSSGGGPLAERWNGTRWIVQPTPNPTSGTEGEMRSVKCLSATVCVATGD